ncbi:ABC transporter permease [Nocardioides sp.]|uniref:ABC transporter permease n=1 Tax=Nocardioides sp. TaxID=35761 RepID=UPI002735DBC8|nr:ABC transporter permease [Nocardioides sp.]MDP3889997.1 ABC transporter permease [Nocardioides sp.]
MSTLTTDVPRASHNPPPSATPRGNLARDTWTVLTREMRPLARDPFQVVFSMIQPLVFLALFAPLLPDLGDTSALQWFVPGIVAMSCLMGTSMVGSNLLLEMQTGSHERLLVAPLRRSALLLGRAMKEIVPMLAQTAIIVAVATPFSFELHLIGVIAGVAILALFCVGAASLSYALALACKGRDWMFWAVQQTILFPILLLAGMLLPVENGPTWLRTASQINPLTHVVDAERALFAGTFPVGTVLGGVAAAAAVAVVGLWVGLRAMHRSS